jgi:hypothetical protein
MTMPRTNFGTDVMQPGQQPRGMVPSYSQGGAIDTEEETNPLMDTMAAHMQVDINAALGVVGDVLSYGRKLHGLGGGGPAEGGGGGEEQHAASMPMKPFSETPKPQPMMPPSALPYGPNEKPFGKRSEGEAEPEGDEGGAIDVAGVIPSQPHSETPRPQPMPGPLPPTNNPFGKRATMSEAEPEPDVETGAIDTEEMA